MYSIINLPFRYIQATKIQIYGYTKLRNYTKLLEVLEKQLIKRKAMRYPLQRYYFYAAMGPIGLNALT